MKNPKHSIVIGKPGLERLTWNTKLVRVLGSKRKRTWSSTTKTNSSAAVNLECWLKDI